MSAALLVIAKAPLPGRVKTRLSPPCTPVEAAKLAEAALRDTLAAVAAVDVRRVLVLDGAWDVPAGFEVIAQRGGGLDERLAAAFTDAGAPALLIGMDTPQVTPALLRAGLSALTRHDAVLGAADDGGYWAIGLNRPDASLLEGVPMSVAYTCSAQRARLHDAGLRVAELPALRDVDDIADAYAVARAAPHGRFAAALAQLRAEAA